MDIADRDVFSFGGNAIEIRTAPSGSFINVENEIVDRADFHGSPLVDHAIRFGTTFTGLIGTHTGPWNIDELPSHGIVVLEHHFADARMLMGAVNSLAQRIIANPSLYDDKGVAAEYYELAKAGYDLLLRHQGEFGFHNGGVPVSLERAGLVSTRLAKGLSKDVEVPGEQRVVTKRTQLRGDKQTDLSVTVKWRDRAGIPNQIGGRVVELADFVNPASGASGAAFVIAAHVEGAPVSTVNHRSISLTRQGVRFARLALGQMGVETTFYSVGECNMLNNHYYLASPDRAVGDAGHILRHFLPSDYQQ